MFDTSGVVCGKLYFASNFFRTSLEKFIRFDDVTRSFSRVHVDSAENMNEYGDSMPLLYRYGAVAPDRCFGTRCDPLKLSLRILFAPTRLTSPAVGCQRRGGRESHRLRANGPQYADLAEEAAAGPLDPDGRQAVEREVRARKRRLEALSPRMHMKTHSHTLKTLGNSLFWKLF